MTIFHSICWADIPAVDLDRAIAFYTAVLGKKVHKESTPDFEFGLLPHEQDSVGGCLVISEESQPSQAGPLVYFNVNERMDAAIQAVIDNGGKVIKEKHSIGPHGWRAIIHDSEGNRVALHSHVE